MSGVAAKPAKWVPNLIKGVYSNPNEWNYTQRGLMDVAKWKREGTKVEFTKEQLDRDFPIMPMNWEAIRNPPPNAIVCTWIGHATMLVQMEGKNIITDPIFSERCAPFQFMGPQRIRPTPCKVSELPKIDHVLLSHNHYDHLDSGTVKDLGEGPQWIVPMGMKNWFVSAGIKNVVELTWWEQFTSKETGLTFVSTPCQHWSRRSAMDMCKTLWCSFAVLGSQKRVYFSGDTGYCPAFEQTGAEYGPFDLALIPIGAYEPRWFMRPQHVNPEEAVQMHIDLKAKRSVGMHWGTFILTDEPVLEPRQKLEEAKNIKGVPKEEFIAPNIGDTQIFN